MKMSRSLDFDRFLRSGAIISIGNDKLLIGYGAQQWMENPPQGSPSFYFPDFFLHKPKPWVVFEAMSEINRRDLLDNWPEVHQQENFQWDSPYKSHFKNCFCDLKATFAHDHLKKAVPYVFEIANKEMSVDRLSYSLRSLLENTKDLQLFLYGFWNSAEGILGATPEILFTNTDCNTIETVACAGTSHSHDECLTSDPKQLLEHQLVVEGICQSLDPLATVEVGELTAVQLRHLSHLLTPIRATLHQNFDFGSLVSALHPTPALGAFPKKKGKQWLMDYQQSLDRGRFGAPVGYINQTAACYVAIRNMQWDAHHVAIGAGCGIVPESIFENEWQEIQLKLRSIKELLAL